MFISHPTTILNEEEEAVSEKLAEVYSTIMHAWELNANSGELAQAMHTFQLFIMKHALQRLGDTHWSSEWYGKEMMEELVHAGDGPLVTYCGLRAENGWLQSVNPQFIRETASSVGLEIITCEECRRKAKEDNGEDTTT